MPTRELQFTERDPVRLWIVLKDAYAELRGFDVLESKGKSVRVPRVTNTDVRALILQWNTELAKAGVVATSNAKDVWKKLVAKWEPAAREMAELAASEDRANVGNPLAQFSQRVRFWDATQRLAIGLSGLKVIPSTWSLVVDSVAEAAIEAPATVAAATKAAAKFVARAATATAKAAGKAAGAAAAGVAEGLGALPIVLAIAAGLYFMGRRKGA